MDRMQTCTHEGGQYAVALPRGSGKTTIGEVEVIRAVVYGFRRFVVLLQATEPLAARSLRKIQRELETNPLLAEDFPEVCFPIQALERIHNRANGQTLDGTPTRIEWNAHICP
jgi:ERCC4-related helicase